ncbi:MAG: GNAT family N-acetyltransferase [Chloroflexi bacterium]|nr:GNAT family N-acetyltransferase [Chloroflexota bacterium]
MNALKVEPVTLEGTLVRLEPPAENHIADLLVSGQATEIWEYLPFGPFKTAEEWREAFVRWQEHATAGDSVPFVVIRRDNERAVGMTAYLDIQADNRGLEIGGTWLTPALWRTAINTECKYLLLRHAFETLGCIRVQLKTDARNIRSQRAIERLGAVKEGVLRKHMIVKNGIERDTVMYSITDTEWPAVKATLEGKLKGQ